MNTDEATTDRAPGASLASRCLITAAIILVAMGLSYIPAPGIDPQAIPAATGNAQLDAVVRRATSVIALAFNPVVTALVIIELLRVLLPRVAAWNTRDLEYTRGPARVLLVLAFASALWQGWGVAASLEEVQGSIPLVPEPGDPFRFTFAMTQIAGVAALMVLANGITRYGIGSGVWVMLAAFELARLPAEMVFLFENAREGLVSSASLLTLLALFASGAAALVYLFRKGIGEGRTAAQSAADLILPLFLGLALGWFFYGLFVVGGSYLAGTQLSPEMFTASSPTRMAFTVGIIALFARLRCRDNRERGWQIAALSAALYVALQLVSEHLGIRLPGADILAIAVCTIALGWHQCTPPTTVT